MSLLLILLELVISKHQQSFLCEFSLDIVTASLTSMSVDVSVHNPSYKTQPLGASLRLSNYETGMIHPTAESLTIAFIQKIQYQ